MSSTASAYGALVNIYVNVSVCTGKLTISPARTHCNMRPFISNVRIMTQAATVSSTEEITPYIHGMDTSGNI